MSDGNGKRTHADGVDDIVQAQLGDERVELEEKGEGLADTACRGARNAGGDEVSGEESAMGDKRSGRSSKEVRASEIRMIEGAVCAPRDGDGQASRDGALMRTT